MCHCQQVHQTKQASSDLVNRGTKICQHRQTISVNVSSVCLTTYQQTTTTNNNNNNYYYYYKLPLTETTTTNNYYYSTHISKQLKWHATVANSHPFLHSQKCHLIKTSKTILHWLDVPERVTFKLCLSIYKCLHGMGPPYLSEMCLPISSLPGSRHLRSAVDGQLVVPRYRLTTAGRWAFSFAGLSAWNSLPTYLNDHTLNLDSFKRFLKSFLFQMYW